MVNNIDSFLLYNIKNNKPARMYASGLLYINMMPSKNASAIYIKYESLLR